LRIGEEGVEFAVRGAVSRGDSRSGVSSIDERPKTILRGISKVAEISLRQIFISIMPSYCCQVIAHLEKVEVSECVVVHARSTKENKDKANERRY
jgi:hypothetical protein